MQEMDRFLRIMELLRRHCPWDAEQTHESLKRYLLEEAHEVTEAIDQNDFEALKGELGDLLLQIVFHSAIAGEQKRFSFDDVVSRISDKMVERHPHVFQRETGITAEEVQRNWEQNKYKKERRDSMLSGIPDSMPALLKAQRMQEKAATVGFEWKRIDAVIDKLQEELDELKQAVHNNDTETVREEYGDILFAIVNLGRFLNVVSEDALNQTNRKFRQRFAFIEKQFNYDMDKMSGADLETLEKFWQNAKEGTSGND